MKKEEMLRTMRMYAHDMKASLGECESLKTDILDVPEDADKLKADFIKSGYKWICEIRIGAWKVYRDVKILLSEEQWERYKNWGSMEEHREMVMLRESLVALRKAVKHRDRPDFYKKGKLNAALRKHAGKSKTKSKGYRANKQDASKRSKQSKR